MVLTFRTVSFNGGKIAEMQTGEEKLVATCKLFHYLTKGHIAYNNGLLI